MLVLMRCLGEFVGATRLVLFARLLSETYIEFDSSGGKGAGSA